MEANLIRIEVAYATPHLQRILSIVLPKGSTLNDAIVCSGILAIFPEIDLSSQKIGVFGEVRQLAEIASDGDRIEIYRELIIDPKEARRKRAAAVKAAV